MSAPTWFRTIQWFIYVLLGLLYAFTQPWCYCTENSWHALLFPAGWLRLGWHAYNGFSLFVAESSRVTYWLGLSGCRSTIINHNVSKAYGCWLLLRSGFGLNALFCKISEKVGYNEKKIIDFQYGYFHKNYDVMIKWLCKGTRVHFPSPLVPNAIYITYLFYKTHKS